MKEKRTPETYIVQICTKKRAQQKKQLLASLRFKNEMEYIWREQQQRRNTIHSKINQQTFERYLIEENIDQLYLVVLYQLLPNMNTIEDHMKVLVQILCNKIFLPKSIITLDNLARLTKQCVFQIFQRNLFHKIYSGLSKFPKSSSQYKTYLSLINQLLKQKTVIDRSQLQDFMYQMQKNFEHKIQEDQQFNVQIQIWASLVQLSTNEFHFQETTLINLCGYFWKVQKPINKARLYEMAKNIIENRLYISSVTLMLNVAAIVCRGRHHFIQKDMDSFSSACSILKNLFYEFNQAYLDQKRVGTLKIPFTCVQTSLHRFFLQYQDAIFDQQHWSVDYFQFLQQFCKNGPIPQIFNLWHQKGLIYQMIQMVSNIPADVCLQILKLLLAIFTKSVQIYTDELGLAFKQLQVVDTIHFIDEKYPSSKEISQLCEAILSKYAQMKKQLGNLYV